MENEKFQERNTCTEKNDRGCVCPTESNCVYAIDD